jgi:hypothetical protein
VRRSRTNADSAGHESIIELSRKLSPMEMRFPLRRLTAMVVELCLDVRLRFLRRRERQALIRLGAAAASFGVPETDGLKRLLAQVREGKLRLDRLRAAIGSSLEADRRDFLSASRWMRPVVVLRGFCDRAVLRHQIVLERRSLMEPHEALGLAMAQDGKARANVPQELVSAAAQARSKLCALSDERSRRLAQYGGSALPRWLPRLGRETDVLSRALWMQLKPHILPRSPALVGLGVGWWLAATYTDSHFRSVLHSLGIGQGGRRVVSGETYRLMMFWLPILAAALCAYLADRAQVVIQRRYIRPAQDQ